MQEFSLSLEGAKSFLKTMQDVLMERKNNIEYKEYCYRASEGEFTIYIKNVDEWYEEEVVIVKIWVNSASIVEENAGYSIGYEFMVAYRALENFKKELQEELCEVLDLNNI